MEYASFLAGERWSDHPACTHPALASLARLVNDWTSDANRSRLSSLIPSVIGLVARDDQVDERIELVIAVRAAAAAMPVASEARQRALAVGLMRCESRMAEVDPGGMGVVHATVRSALDNAPLAERWAAQQLAAVRSRHPRSSVLMYDAMVNLAVAGIGEACTPDPDDLLREMLRTTIEEVALLVQGSAPVKPVEATLTLA